MRQVVIWAVRDSTRRDDRDTPWVRIMKKEKNNSNRALAGTKLQGSMRMDMWRSFLSLAVGGCN